MDHLFFVPTTARCKIKGHSYPGIPVFFDECGVIRHASDFMVHLVYGQRRPTTTARTYAMHLQRFLKHLKVIDLAWDQVTDGTLFAWRDMLLEREGLASGTVAAYLITVFGFYLWAEETSRIQFAVAIYDHDDASGDSRDRQYRISASRSSRRGHYYWPHLPRVEASSVRHTPVSSEIERLHVEAFYTQTGQRDSLVLSLFEECSLRRAEALGLTVDDVPTWDEIEIALAKGTVFHLSILGKGAVTRTVEAPTELMAWAREYIEGDRAEAVDRAKQRNSLYKEPKALFLAQTTARPLTKDHLSRRISGLMRSVDIENASGHRLRAAGLTARARAYDGVDESGRPFPKEQVLIKLAQYAGHRNIRSLEPYLDNARSSSQAPEIQDQIRDTASVHVLRRKIAALKAKLSSVPAARPTSKARKRSRRRT